MSFATVAQVRRSLRIDDDDAFNDADMTALINTASEMVRAYIKRDVIEETDEDTSPPTVTTVMDLTSSPPVIPARVVQATIALVGYLYRAPDSNPENAWSHGRLPPPVTSLLYTFRLTTLA